MQKNKKIKTIHLKFVEKCWSISINGVKKLNCYFYLDKLQKLSYINGVIVKKFNKLFKIWQFILKKKKNYNNNNNEFFSFIIIQSLSLSLSLQPNLSSPWWFW